MTTGGVVPHDREIGRHDDGAPRTRPPSFPDNFAPEAFWWAAETTLAYPGGEALLVLAQEAAFENDVVVTGDQIAFGRVRIRATGLIPGAWYRFTHPYGTIDLQADGQAPRVVNYTRDVGCVAAPCADAFGSTAGSDIGPKFLQWDTTESAPPEGHIGNPSFPHKVVGSTHVPAGETEPANYFRIERITGPGGTVTSTVGQTDRFLVQGKLAGPPSGAFIARTGAFEDTLVGSSSERTVTIRNGGSGDLRLGDLALAGTHRPDFSLAAETCSGTVLEPAGQCTVRVAFHPSAPGARSARIEVAGAEDGSVHQVALTGLGTVPPAPSGGGQTVFVPVPVPVPAPVAAVPVAGQAVAGASAAAPRLALRTLALASRISRTRVRLQGLRLVMRLPAETDVVRVRIFRVGANGRRRLESQSFRVPTASLFRMRITDRRLLARLTPGRYLVEVTPGRSRTRLGAPTLQTLRIVR
jgi:hypothetical protein